MDVEIIVAFDKEYGIGKDGKMAWYCKEDLAHFRRITNDNIVIMGRKTWESLPSRMQPLPNRLNIVVSSTYTSADLPENVILVKSLNEAISAARSDFVYDGKKIFVIGGAELYKEAAPYARVIHTTQMNGTYDCDVFFDRRIIESNLCREIHTMEIEGEDEKIVGWWVTYLRSNAFDATYLRLVETVLDNGYQCDNRTGIPTIKLAGMSARYDLSKGIPILTTKYVNYEHVIRELLWMLSGSTNTKELSAQGVRIWDANTTREFLDNRGLDYPEGEAGPIYGFQMRYCGAKYPSREGGIDQIANIIDLLKNNPNDRRILMDLWNVNDIDKMALPPCHMMYQFIVIDGKLSCSMYQRSGDIGLGVPYNILSASILTHIFANIADMEVGELIHTIGDAHIYVNHVEALKQQMYSPMNDYAQLMIYRKLTGVDDLTIDDFSIHNYTPGPVIKMKMAV